MDTRMDIGLRTEGLRERALRMQTEALQQAPEASDESLPERFEGVLIVEGVRSGDDREIAPDALTHRDLPLPLMLMGETGGHSSDRVAGSIDTLERVDTEVGAEWRMSGTFDLDGEDGREAARLVASGMLRWVSADLDDIGDVEFIEEGDCDTEDDDIILANAADGDSDVDSCRIIMRLLEGRIMGGTLLAFPAFQEAVIHPEGVEPDTEEPEEPEEPTDEPEPEPEAEVVAHAGEAERPPAEWFENPNLDGPQRYVTVTDEGRIYGHLAVWNECHIGLPDRCLTPNDLRSQSDYAHFHVGHVETGDGTVVGTGPITLRGGHAQTGPGVTVAMARSHYADTDSAVADVRIGEDDHGIWFSGALRPDADDTAVRRLKASGVSGDWRNIGGAHELIAVCSVNTPGFPKVRGLVADGHVQSIVAAGGPPEPAPASDLDVTTLRREVAMLREQVAFLSRHLEPSILAFLDERVAVT